MPQAARPVKGAGARLPAAGASGATRWRSSSNLVRVRGRVRVRVRVRFGLD